MTIPTHPDKNGMVGYGIGFERIRRIALLSTLVASFVATGTALSRRHSVATGYLVGTLDRFNNAKRAEEKDRVKHGGITDAPKIRKTGQL